MEATDETAPTGAIGATDAGASAVATEAAGCFAGDEHDVAISDNAPVKVAIRVDERALRIIREAATARRGSRIAANIPCR